MILKRSWSSKALTITFHASVSGMPIPRARSTLAIRHFARVPWLCNNAYPRVRCSWYLESRALVHSTVVLGIACTSLCRTESVHSTFLRLDAPCVAHGVNLIQRAGAGGSEE
ncbi:hypothetical protein BDW72DRAFT_76388 [Aspergillus terricola var. indicus]